MLDAFVTYLGKEWSVISQAPLIFIMAAMVVCTIAYLAARWRYTGRISHLVERINLRDDRIAEYERKLGGATPDEAKARLDALEAKVSELMPRELSKAQIEKIIEYAARPKTSEARISIVVELGCSDGQRYAAQFVRAFEMTPGWRVEQGQMIGGKRPPVPSGIGVRLKNPAILTEAEDAVTRAFGYADIKFDPLGARALSASDVELVIGSPDNPRRVSG
jgi:hypothetical protein